MSISLGPFRIPITTRRAVDASYEERPHPYHPKFFGGEGGAVPTASLCAVLLERALSEREWKKIKRKRDGAPFFSKNQFTSINTLF